MLPKILIAGIIVTLAYFGYTQYFSKNYISQDTLIAGDYNPDSNKTIVFKNNATLTVEGNAVIKNPVECQNGSVNTFLPSFRQRIGKQKCWKKEEDQCTL